MSFMIHCGVVVIFSATELLVVSQSVSNLAIHLVTRLLSSSDSYKLVMAIIIGHGYTGKILLYFVHKLCSLT